MNKIGIAGASMLDPSLVAVDGGKLLRAGEVDSYDGIMNFSGFL